MKQKQLPTFLILLALGLLLLLPSVNSYTLSVTTSDEVRVGDNLKILILLVNTTSSENVSGIGCTVYTLDRNNNTVEGGLVTYDSVLNDPASLLTNIGGRAYYSLRINNRYPVYDNATLVADCAGAVALSSFYVLPYNNVDQVANMYLSLKESSYSWIALGLGILIIGAFLIIGVKKLVDLY